MKNFFISFLATLAGIWFSLFLAFFAFLLIIAAAIASSLDSPTVKIDKNSVLKIDLSGEILDTDPMLDVITMIRNRDNGWQLLSDITGSIKAAADDDRIDGIVIDCSGAIAGIAQRTAIIEALEKFQKEAPDKWIYAYADMYTQGDYYIASVADSLFINPVGQVDIHGLSATTMYFHRLLQKIGVDMQVIKVGTYKSAVEPYTLDNMSEPSREQQQLFLDNIWEAVSTRIAKGRGISRTTVDKWADNFVFAKDTKTYPELKIVDAIAYRHEFDEKIAGLTDHDKADDISYVSTAQYAKASDLSKTGDGKGADIAVLYACGEITDYSGEGIVGSDMVEQILDLADDDDIDGLIMYVNSPGGSAFASEQIWEALEQFKKISGKPFFVSMADYAASGGYYISCGADRIFAQPVTLTGSIGIFGLIPNVKGLLSDKLGVNTGTVKTNENGNFPSIMEPMSETQKAAMQSYVERGYELFTSRCAKGRDIPQDSIKKIGEGRVWDGSEALKLGLVDELGGLDAAIAAMAKQLNVETYTIKTYPSKEKEWYKAILKSGGELKADMVRDELGEMADLYDTLRRIKGMSTMQARMDFTEIEL